VENAVPGRVGTERHSYDEVLCWSWESLREIT
jgi:hypothetical protein